MSRIAILGSSVQRDFLVFSDICSLASAQSITGVSVVNLNRTLAEMRQPFGNQQSGMETKSRLEIIRSSKDSPALGLGHLLEVSAWRAAWSPAGLGGSNDSTPVSPQET